MFDFAYKYSYVPVPGSAFIIIIINYFPCILFIVFRILLQDDTLYPTVAKPGNTPLQNPVRIAR